MLFDLIQEREKVFFEEFNNLHLDHTIGVSAVGEDTQLLAQSAKKISGINVLDVGTGTGFIALYLGSCGFQCTGIDINTRAIQCAKKNAQKNGIKANFYVSDLFQSVHGVFDIIVFNPPFGNVNSVFGSRYIELIKSLIPKDNKVIAKISFLFIKRSRRKLIERFLKKCFNHLTKNGSVVLFLHPTELSLFDAGEKYEILGKSSTGMCVVCVKAR